MNTTHDPQAVLDYQYDWTEWLNDGDTIATASVAVDSGDVVIDSISHDAQKVTVWVSGGSIRTWAHVVCHITTLQGRQDDRTIQLYVSDR